jgi:hypothetical protein
MTTGASDLDFASLLRAMRHGGDDGDATTRIAYTALLARYGGDVSRNVTAAKDHATALRAPRWGERRAAASCERSQSVRGNPCATSLRRAETALFAAATRFASGLPPFATTSHSGVGDSASCCAPRRAARARPACSRPCRPRAAATAGRPAARRRRTCARRVLAVRSRDGRLGSPDGHPSRFQRLGEAPRVQKERLVRSTRGRFRRASITATTRKEG